MSSYDLAGDIFSGGLSLRVTSDGITVPICSKRNFKD